MSKFDSTSAQLFQCPHHIGRQIEGIDPDLSAHKNLYCTLCLLESEDPKTLFNKVQSIPAFIDTAAKLFAQEKALYEKAAENSQECLQMLSNKAFIMAFLDDHINEQKKKVEEQFDYIKTFVSDLLEKKKAEYLKILNEQVNNLHIEYDAFEKAFRTYYPGQEDIESLFPSKEDIEGMFKGVKSLEELDNFVAKIKKEVDQNKESVEKLFSNEFKMDALDQFRKQYMQIKVKPPVFDMKVQAIKEKISRTIDKLAESSYEVQNQIITGISELLLGSKELCTIKTWLPEEYRNKSKPKLIFKSLRDGLTGESLFSRCEGKGPTITLIKGRFEGATEPVVIGSFLDKPWTQNGIYIISKEAFIFSLTAEVKCPIVDTKNAAFISNKDPIIAFGAGHDIAILKDVEKCYVRPHSYKDTEKIICSPKYKPSPNMKTILFKPIDVEVYVLE